MTPDQKSTGNGGKIALLAAAAIGGFLIFGGSSNASAATPVAKDPCKDLTDKAGPILATATKADLPALGELLKSAQTAGCADLVLMVAKKITDLSKPVVTPPAPPKVVPGSVFNAANAKDPIRAYNLAVAFSNGKPSNEWAAANPSKVASNGTFNTLADYGAYPGNSYSITVFQDASGLIADGKVGPQTNAAFGYWLGHGGKRPDGSTDVRIAGESSIAGESLCTSCGGELDVAVGSCCSGCAAGAKSCGEKAATEQIEAVMAIDPQFGAIPFGGIEWGGGGFGGAGPNPKPDIGGCSTGSCGTPMPKGGKVAATLQGETTPAQSRALQSLGALKSKVGGEYASLIEVAENVVRSGDDVDLSLVPVAPGTEPVIECLKSYVQERSAAPA